MAILRSLLPEPFLPERFLKVPVAGESTSAAPVFVPAWDIKIDNLAVDGRSLRDFAEHAIPPAVKERLARLPANDASRARLLMSFWDFALQCDEQERTERLNSQVRQSHAVVSRQELEITNLKARTAQLEGHLQIANEARAKAEADLLAERQQKEAATAALAPVQEQATAAAAEKAALAAEHEQLKSRFDDLTTDLAAARKEVSELETACQLHIKDYNDATVKGKELADDLERLQKGIPGLVKRAIASDSVTDPFKELLTAVQEVEVLQTINLISEHVPDLPAPLPDAIVSKVNPDCVERAQRASEALQTLTIPFIERIGSEVLSVDEILGMQP